MRKGLTLLELLIAMALLVILMVITIRALNPFGQFASARNSQRKFHLETIVNAIRSNLANTRTGVFTCLNGDIPTTTKRMASGAGNYDVAPCLISTSPTTPSYLDILPVDPSASSSYWNSIADYDTGYNVFKNASSGAITITAPYAELGKAISVTR